MGNIPSGRGEYYRYIYSSRPQCVNIQKGGHILIWFSLVWSLEMYQQTNARLWRQGQKEVVTIHHILTRDTVDSDVLDALKNKDTTQQNLISAVKANLTI